MVSCDLIGRMGNQMFQIATSAAHAWRVGQSFAFPDKAQGSYTGETYFKHLPKVNPRRLFRNYTEHSHRYSPIPAYLKDVKLHGYWQCEKYFVDKSEEIIDLFGIVPVLSDHCSVHIRLCDYIQFKDKHPPVTAEYLYNAMDLMVSKSHTRKFLVFSDDLQAAKSILKEYIESYATGVDVVYCDVVEPKLALAIMAGCVNNIIANSSFSWWGAWLNPNPDKIVIAPSVWFGPGNSNLDPTDIYCENWIKI